MRAIDLYGFYADLRNIMRKHNVHSIQAKKGSNFGITYERNKDELNIDGAEFLVDNPAKK